MRTRSCCSFEYFRPHYDLGDSIQRDSKYYAPISSLEINTTELIVE